MLEALYLALDHHGDGVVGISSLYLPIGIYRTHHNIVFSELRMQLIKLEKRLLYLVRRLKLSTLAESLVFNLNLFAQHSCTHHGPLPSINLKESRFCGPRQ